MDNEEVLTPGAFNTLTNSLAQAPVNEFTTGNSGGEHIQIETEGHVQGEQLVVRRDATTDDRACTVDGQ